VNPIAAAGSNLVRRFRTERQILAGLEHPHIARLLDGGETADGLPFLVMEYVEGLPIDQYVAQNRLSHRALLDLFRKICSAVSYAHQKLIVHHDLKPGNILVTGEGEPKLLDFGIAKLLGGSLELTATAPGMGALTPRYASPEQVKNLPITTSTDIYSLGVLLYELLSGSRPYAPTTSSLDLARAICERPPLAMQNVERDLETIVQMTLRKEPERRYASVDLFSEDLRRFLAGYPVAARPDTARYRASKFMGRNKVAIAAAALVAIALAAGIFTTAREARIANRRFNEVRSLAHYFVFDVHDGIKDLPGSTAVRQKIVEKALEYLDTLSREQSNDRDLQRELASAYEQIAGAQGGIRDVINQGNGADALASYRKAAAIREALVAAHPRDSAELQSLASLYSGMGSVQTQSFGDLKGGVQTLRKSVSAAERAVAAEPSSDEARNVLADSYLMLGDSIGNPSYQNLGDSQGAEQLYRKASALRDQLAVSHPGSREWQIHLAMSENRLAMILASEGKDEASLPHLRRVLEIDENALAADPNNASTRANTETACHNLAMVLHRAGHREEALSMAHRATSLAEQVARDDRNDTSLAGVASAYYTEGNVISDDARALPLFDKSIALYSSIAARHPAEAPPVAMRTAYRYRGQAAIRLRQPAVAFDSANALLAISAGLLKTDPNNATARSDRAQAYSLLGAAYELRQDPARAVPAFKSALGEYAALKSASGLSPRDEKYAKDAAAALDRLENQRSAR
jgi:tetratricopeptide (TPR) repeat protein